MRDEHGRALDTLSFSFPRAGLFSTRLLLLGFVTIVFASNGVCIEDYGNSDVMALVYGPTEYRCRLELRCCFGV